MTTRASKPRSLSAAARTAAASAATDSPAARRARRPSAAERRALLRELLASGEAASQDELVAGLEQRGVMTTQSAVSRDLELLGAARVAGRYRLLAPSPALLLARPPVATPDLPAELTGFVRGVASAGPHLLVVRTVVGGAQAVAVAVDAAAWPGVVGTIAGDDTIFLATADPAAQRSAERRFRMLARAR